MKVLLCGGGTGGHVMPAIAISEIIEKNFKNSSIAFAGRSNGDENKAYIKTGHKLYTIEISGISRSFSINAIKSIIRVIKSGRDAKQIIEEFKPDMIIGTGGYVCYPFIRQGQRLNIATLIHESNVYPGLVTKILGNRCEKLLLNHDETKKYLKNASNTVVVGNPTRAGFKSINRKKAREALEINEDELLIVSFGGSLGSKKINEVIVDFSYKYILNDKAIKLIHATGLSNFDQIKSSNPTLFSRKSNVLLLPYIENMTTVLTAADIAITRSGATTLSELCVAGTPSILIPSPNVTANHQYFNAKLMKESGAAELIEEKNLTSEMLYRTVVGIYKNPDRMRKMRNHAFSLHKENTSEMIAKALISVYSDKNP